MASGSSYSPKPNKNKNKNIIHVHADQSNFREVVQKLTGASPASQKKLPVANSPYPSNAKHNPVDVRPVIPSFMLQDQRQTARNLQLQLNQNGLTHVGSAFAPRVINVWPFVQQEIAMANKGFYSHPSPQATSSKVEPQLLPLFPTTPNS